ncbi:Putative transmembrane protein (PGPGW) [Jatrophihabitans endophyticus]|uniref:Putative transmembrane protein (PGPGW) n=1 Tax=Jatrophihabitans endophyticus TaxID=1206085 RepID=A0A1M5BZA3_9ACTN|nr:PGPGW domain-containing protein [Jatrophihabitans endophyticus]SHF47863.1 Putative transmembrane protein (PGPGW) [Jatrophihabitans endophyticus]
MASTASAALKRVALEGLGWLLVVGGIVALVLPGPGLLAIVAGLALLSQQYDWARRRLEPAKQRALQAAADGVSTWPRILMSATGAAFLVALGVLWGLKPDVPGWWPLADSWWLPGGWGTGASLIVSGLVAAALIVYSYRNFREIKATDPTP